MFMMNNKLGFILLVGLLGACVDADSCNNRCGTFDLNSYDCQCNDQCSYYGNCCSDYESLCATSSLSCAGRCGPGTVANTCQCNDHCIQFRDCCVDYEAQCVYSSSTNSPSTTSSSSSNDNCSGRCGTFDLSLYDCQCNSECDNHGNCCPDYLETCTAVSTGSCSGRCGAGTDPDESCQCNTYCIQYGDCCSDYSEHCGTSTSAPPTGSCPQLSVTNTEIEYAALDMWDLDINSAVYSDDVTFNIQSSTTTGATNDVAPSNFFTYVNEEVLNRPTFLKLRALQDNYIRNQGNTEVVTDEELAENSDFLDAILATAVGQKLFQFLDSKNLAGCNGLGGFKDILNSIWFGMYDRQAPDDTSGFEHSFVGEIKGTGVSGFHSWVNFYHEEIAGNFNYQGHLAVQDPNMVGMRHTWYGATKPRNGFTVGFSPELEFGLYSLCYLTKPGKVCAFKLRDASGAEVIREIQTWTWTNEIPPNNLPLYIASAYFLT